MIFPAPNDHEAHLAIEMPHHDCEACRRLPRWPIKKIGYLIPNGQGFYKPVGWEFDTSAPGTYPWLVQDIVQFAITEKALSALITIDNSERNAHP